jgi:C1A family cysteine protease
MTQHKYGYLPDQRDQRDHLYAAPFATLQALPSSVDLRSGCPPIRDQGMLGACTGFAISAAIEFDRRKQKLEAFATSPLFVYYNERMSEGTIDSDAGATIRDGIKAVNKLGVCKEQAWPYLIERFTSKPPAHCYKDALKCRAVSYQRVVRSLDQLRGCLAAGFPFVMGISVYDSFESAEVAQSGVVPMPSRKEALLGGHACLCVGYRNDTKKWIFRNSWSEQWGDKGYGYLDYQYLLNQGLSGDFWTVRFVG